MTDMSNFKSSNFVNELELKLWKLNFDSSIDINTQINQLIQTFSEVLNKSAPLRPTTKWEIRIRLKLWLTKGILKSIKFKNNLYKRLILKEDLAACGSYKIDWNRWLNKNFLT